MIQCKNDVTACLCFCFVVLFLLQDVSSRGVTYGGRYGSSNTNNTNGSRNSNNNNAAAANGGLKSASQIKSPSNNNNIPNNPQSQATGAFLIPTNGGVFPIYRNPSAQEVTSYYKREGSGMSAWGIVALILGVVGGGTGIWFCYMVGLPIWRDRHRRNTRSSMSRRPPEGIPLQQATPSTATPSPCIAVCLPS